MKRKWIITLVVTIGCAGVAVAEYQPVRAMIAPITHQLSERTITHHIGKVLHTKKSQLKTAQSGSASSTHTAGAGNANNAQSSDNGSSQTSATHTTQSSNSTQSNQSAQSNNSSPSTSTSSAGDQTVQIDVPAQNQMPELYNGCEVTSLSMLLTAAGHPVDKMTLADRIPKDPTPATYDSNNNITAWGDPNVGFVGDVSGADPGYGVYHGPVTQLLNSILPGQAVDLTGESFDQVLAQVQSGKPVVAWTTANFTPTVSWTTWQGPNGPVKATFDEHVVLIVGYNDNQVIINDPLDGTAAKEVDRQAFTAAWQQLGNQAVSYKD